MRCIKENKDFRNGEAITEGRQEIHLKIELQYPPHCGNHKVNIRKANNVKVMVNIVEDNL
jgi:hypothetical protein